jgi:hypothetical protein
MSDVKFGLRFGAMAPKFSEQLTSQGLLYDESDMKRFEELFIAMMTLRFADILNDKPYEAAQKKLYKQIENHIIKKNKLKRVSTHDTTPA